VSDPTRRRLLITAGALAATGLACGSGPEDGRAPGKKSRPAPSKPKPAPTSHATAPEGGTLFLPPDQVEGTVPTTWTDRPEWFRRAPGIYLATPVTSGGSSLLFSAKAKWAMPSRISHFKELPTFLDEAKKLGTNVLYLVDVYQGPEDWPPVKWRLWKEHFRIREDLGGAKALRKAIDQVHAKGGKVILYVTGFAMNRESPLGKEKGAKWAIIQDGEPIDRPYPDQYMGCPYVKEWREHVVGICARYAQEVGADGVHVDSLGNQRGWKCESTEHGHEPGDGEAFNVGSQRLLSEVRTAMRKHVPEAVVLCEGDKLSRLFTGAIDGSQDWGIHDLSQRWVWNQAGNTAIFCANWSLDDMHQIVAIGHKWMLTPYWLDPPRQSRVTAWLEAEVPSPSLKGDWRSRRMELERVYLGLHAFRNAALLAGKVVPGLDDLTHRRWDGEEIYASREASEAHVVALRERAAMLDAAIGGPVDLTAVAEHLRRVMEARASLSKDIDDGATVSLVTSVAGKASAYLWDGRAKTMAVVNVSDTAATLDLSKGGKVRGRFRDVISGREVQVGPKTQSPPHSLMFLRPV
jgi:hypothetical protein